MIVVKIGEKGVLASTETLFPGKMLSQYLMSKMWFAALNAFDAAFLASILNGYRFEEALERGNGVGALVVRVRGDIEALPARND